MHTFGRVVVVEKEFGVRRSPVDGLFVAAAIPSCAAASAVSVKLSEDKLQEPPAELEGFADRLEESSPLLTAFVLEWAVETVALADLRVAVTFV